MANYTKEELQQAREWFRKFGELLKANGIDLDNPYALGLVAITRDLPTPFINADTATPQEIAEAITSVNDGEVYAFMERNEDGTYKNGRTENGKSGQWVRDNMKTFAEVEASDDHVMNLFKMAQEGRLYVSETKVFGDAFVEHKHVFTDKDGNLQLAKNFDALVDDVRSIKNEIEEAQRELDMLTAEEALAVRGKKMDRVPITNEEVDQFREEYFELQDNLQFRESAFKKGEYTDGRKIPTEKFDEVREQLKKDYRKIKVLRENIDSQSKAAEVDLTVDKEALLQEIRRNKVAPQKKLDEANQKKFKFLEQGMTMDQFKKIFSAQQMSRGNTMLAGQLKTNLTFRTTKIVNRAKKNNQPELIASAKQDFRNALYGKAVKQEERNLCVLGTLYPKWVDRLGADNILAIQKTGIIPPEDWTTEEIALNENAFFDSGVFEDIKRSLLSKTKLPTLEEVARSGKVFRANGDPYPTDSFDFMKAVVEDNKTKQGIGIRYEKNGKVQQDIFLTNTDMGLMKAYNVEQYRKEFNSLAKELLATDNMFSRDSSSYKALRASLVELQGEFDKSAAAFASEGMLSEMVTRCEAYQREHKDMNPLSDRQQRRLDVMNRICSLNDMIKAGHTFIENRECKASQVADRMLHAQAMKLQKGKGEAAAEGCKLQLDRAYFMANKAQLMKNPVFEKMIALADETTLNRMTSMDGEKLIEGMNKLGEKLMEATVEMNAEELKKTL